jgi:hypothetical protein
MTFWSWGPAGVMLTHPGHLFSPQVARPDKKPHVARVTATPLCLSSGHSQFSYLNFCGRLHPAGLLMGAAGGTGTKLCWSALVTVSHFSFANINTPQSKDNKPSCFCLAVQMGSAGHRPQPGVSWHWGPRTWPSAHLALRQPQVIH